MLKKLLISWHVRERSTFIHEKKKYFHTREKELLLSVVTTTVEETACILVC